MGKLLDLAPAEGPPQVLAPPPDEAPLRADEVWPELVIEYFDLNPGPAVPGVPLRYELAETVYDICGPCRIGRHGRCYPPCICRHHRTGR